MPRETRLHPGLLLAAALGVGSALPATATAQDATTLAKGATVRVVSSAVGGQRRKIVKGRLVRLEDQSVTIDAEDGREGPRMLSFNLHQGWRLQRLAGTRRQGGTGAAVGAVAGAALMGVALAAVGDCDGFCRTNAGEAIAALSIGAAAGGAIGLVIGSLGRGDRWVPVQTSGVRVTLAPGRLGVRVAF